VRWLKEHQDDSYLVYPDDPDAYPTMTRVLNDFDSGIALFGASPNVGKSTIMVNMMMDALDLNEDIIVVDITLDDPFKKRLVQYLACKTSLYYQQLFSPSTLTESERRIKQEALDHILRHVDAGKLHIFEGTETYDLGGKVHSVSIREFSKLFRLMSYFRRKHPTKKIVFFIDAWNNLDFSKEAGLTELAKQESAVNRLHDVAREENIMVVSSAHLKKSKEKIRSLGDIKGTALLLHAVVWAGVVINEFRENITTDPLLAEIDGYLYPVIIVEVQKTKVSSWEGPLFYTLMSGKCKIIPPTKAEYMRFREIVRGRV
jgi:Fe2+ transport system protein FeoA